MSEATANSAGWTDGALARLYALQRTPRRRWPLAGFAAAVGVALATVHWSGLLVGGALVGLCWPTLRRAVVAGLAFAVVVLAVAAARLFLAGTLGDALAMTPLTYVAVATPLVACPLGATARGLVPDAPAGTGEAEENADGATERADSGTESADGAG